MAMILYDDILLIGIIKIKKSTPSVLDLGFWKSHEVCLRKSSSVGPLRIQLDSISRSSRKKKETDENGKIPPQKTPNKNDILLRDVGKLAITAPDKMVNSFYFTFRSSNNKVYLAFDSFDEMSDWKQMIEAYLPAVSRGVDLLNDANYQTDINDPIHVFLLCTPLLSFYGECQMVVTHGNLLLCHPDDSTQTFIAWPLTSIKKYTCDKDKFIMQTGRSCKTGEGLFIFNTYMGKIIVEKIKNEGTRSSIVLPPPPLQSEEETVASSSFRSRSFTARPSFTSSTTSSSSRSNHPLPPIPQNGIYLSVKNDG